jgi:hypothetical protein
LKLIKYAIFVDILLLLISCRQFGGKIAFIDDEYLRMREDEKNGKNWREMYDAYYEKWTINGLHLWLVITADHTVFSSKNPYSIAFQLEKTKDVKENYTLFYIRDVKINGTSGKDYQTIADKYFPITAKLDNTDFITVRGSYATPGAFPLTFEKLTIVFTVDVNTVDIKASKTFEYAVTPFHNRPEPIWDYMWR